MSDTLLLASTFAWYKQNVVKPQCVQFEAEKRYAQQELLMSSYTGHEACAVIGCKIAACCMLHKQNDVT